MNPRSWIVGIILVLLLTTAWSTLGQPQTQFEQETSMLAYQTSAFENGTPSPASESSTLESETATHEDVTPTLPPTETPTPESEIVTSVSLSDLGQEDLFINGLEGTGSIWIPLPANWIIEDVQVELSYIGSSLLHEERASLTVLTRDQPVASIQLLGNGNEQRVSFTVPVEYIYQGSGFSLDFGGYLRLTDAVCEETNNPAQWVNITNDTNLTIGATLDRASPKLEELSRAIVVRNSLETPPSVIFVLPDNLNGVALTTAAQIAARLGEQIGRNIVRFEVVMASNLTEQQMAESNLVVVGLPEDQPLIHQMAENLPAGLEENSFLTIDGSPAPPEQGIIQIFNAPWNDALKILLVSAGNEAGLQLAGQAFASSSAFQLLTGEFQFVENVEVRTSLSPEAPWLMPRTTFAQLDYSNQTVTGPGVSSVYYYLRRPPGWVLESGSQLTLNLAYSPALEPGSHVAVFINDVFVGAMQPGQTQSTFELPIADLNGIQGSEIPQTLEIQLDVANIMSIEICQDTDPETAWTSIQADSFLVISHSYVPLPDLQAFPYPFASDQLDVPVVIVLPAQPEEYEVSAALSIATTLGKYALGDLALSVLTSDQVSEETHADAHLIILGMRTRQPLVDEFLAMMPSVSEDDLYQTLRSDTAGILRETLSPWNTARVILLIVSETEVGFTNAANALFDAALPTEGAGLVTTSAIGQTLQIIYDASLSTLSTP